MARDPARHLLAAVAGVVTFGVVAAVRAFLGSPRSRLEEGSGMVDLEGHAVWLRVPPRAERRVVVYLHGHGGNVSKLGPALASEFARAQGAPIVVMPQLGAKSEPGTLGEPDALRALLAALYRGTPEVRAVELLAHSGGYKAAAAAIDHGGISVSCVGLLDALYGEVETFEGFATSSRARHFANVYGPSTATNSRALGGRLVARLGSRAALDGNPSTFTRKAATVESDVSHDAVPARYIVPMLDAFRHA